MSTNEERREAAKRKLEERLEAERQQTKRRRNIIGGISGVVVLAILATAGFFGYRAWDDSRRTECTYADVENDPFANLPAELDPDTPEEQKDSLQSLLDLYKQGKGLKREEPKPDDRPLKEGTVQATIDTNLGALPVTLDRKGAACNVNAFISLAQDGYYDGVPCHAMIVTDKDGALVCGDPTQTTGTTSGMPGGDPGWTVPDEAPEGLKPADDVPAEQQMQTPMVIYPRGTIAMTNANGSMATNTGSGAFYVFLKDTAMPGTSAVLGHVDEDGLKVLDQVQKNGIAVGPGGKAPEDGKDPVSGKPKKEFVFESISVDD